MSQAIIQILVPNKAQGNFTAIESSALDKIYNATKKIEKSALNNQEFVELGRYSLLLDVHTNLPALGQMIAAAEDAGFQYRVAFLSEPIQWIEQRAINNS